MIRSTDFRMASPVGGRMGLIYKSWHPRTLNHQIRLRFGASFVLKNHFQYESQTFLAG